MAERSIAEQIEAIALGAERGEPTPGPRLGKRLREIAARVRALEAYTGLAPDPAPPYIAGPVAEEEIER